MTDPFGGIPLNKGGNGGGFGYFLSTRIETLTQKHLLRSARPYFEKHL